MTNPIDVIYLDGGPLKVQVNIEDSPINVKLIEVSDEELDIQIDVNQEPVGLLLDIDQDPLPISYIQIVEKGEPGADGSDAVGGWITYVTGFSVIPTLFDTIPTGDVYQYTYADATILYRFIATDLSEDAFYNTFESEILSGLVATKAL